MTEPKWTPGHVVWRELMTTDVEATRAFYGELLGWTFSDMPMPGGHGTYTIVQAGERGVAGVMKNPPDAKFPPYWGSYVSVVDVDASCEAAKKLGGQVMWGPVDMEGVGRMATLMDADGAVISVMRSEKGDEGPGGPPGLGTFCWESLNTANVDKAKTFYGAVCGWKTATGPVPGMTVFAAQDDTTVVDVSPTQDGVPPCFVTYVVVQSRDAARDKAAKLGAKVLMGDIAVPGVGLIAMVADPTGAVIGLFQPQMPQG